MLVKLIIFFSAVAEIIGVLLLRRGARILSNGRPTQATIIANEFRSGTDGEGGVYHPIIEFLIDNNQKVVKTLNVGFTPARRVGKVINIIYNPDDPKDLVTNPSLQLIIIPRVLIAIGSTFLIAGMLDLAGFISLEDLAEKMGSYFNP